MAANKYPDGDIRAGDHRVQESFRVAGPVESGPTPKLSAEAIEFVELWGGQWGLLIYKLNEDAALNVMRAAIRARREQKQPVTLLTPLIDVFEPEVANMLERHHGALTMADLLALPQLLIDATPMIGAKRGAEIRAKIRQLAQSQGVVDG